MPNIHVAPSLPLLRPCELPDRLGRISRTQYLCGGEGEGEHAGGCEREGEGAGVGEG